MSVFITQAGHGGQAHFNWKTKQQFLEAAIRRAVEAHCKTLEAA